ncbi:MULTISPECIES: hypothetical protein [unclassified Halomonas]|uniref:hypothetical protein n=1 Tax=unclassified Halomonas TaxID=2609666 RepID=UPI001C9784FC|nr:MULTISPECIES: hypothetical protein [unclassified Halomonas]MBY5926193.1 hypothetical protein [Halomonas sp. DP4Y7-2]MBY6233235.1 hypothetical protein [Halomonas sp. DP4Y7-1]
MKFLKGAKDFARNPLGIIALFISLIYGFASLLLDSAAESLTVAERWPLIIFIVVFPVLVLITFYKLVINHHGKLYAPGDFQDDKSFLRTLTPEEQEEKLEKEVTESLCVDEESEELKPQRAPIASADAELEERQKSHREFREELKIIERSVINHIASELKVDAEINIGIGETEAKFDAFLQAPSGKFTFLEVKAFRSPHTLMMVLDRILYQAVIADRYFESKFKLILAVVYYFEEEEIERVKRMLKKKVDRCPVDIELRFLPRSKVINA